MNKFLSLIGRVLVYRFKFAREHKHLSVVARFCLMGMLMSSLEWLPGRDIFAQTGTVNARLRLISHTYNYPTSGQATLVMVEDFLCTDPSGCAISGCNSATFQLDPILNAQVTSVSLAIPDFGEVDVNTQGTDYRASDGRIRFIYTAGTAFATIPQTGMVMLTATIQYTMTAGNGSFLWFDGLPYFAVYDATYNNITGNKEAIPSNLTSIPLDRRVNARLRLVSHTYNSPTDGQATLVMVEDFLCTDPNGCAIRGCNSATIQLDSTLNTQVTNVSLAIPDFGEVDVNTQGTDYRASDGRIRFIYTAGTAFATIPQTGMVMLTATIQYTMTAGNGAFLWFDGLPTFYVVDTENNNITGSKETIPADLTSIPLGERNDYLLWTK